MTTDRIASGNNILLLVGRDDWQKDATLVSGLLHQLRKHRIEIVWEDPVAPAIFALRKFERRFGQLSKSAMNFNLRVVQLLYCCVHPSYIHYLKRTKKSQISTRCEYLKQKIRARGIAERTIVFSRSSGGRIASLIADELGLKHVICLGYPFKRPDLDEEPERFAHLAQLRTPMLIIQGLRDSYGGLEVKDKYVLSEKIQLRFIDTDHNFVIGEATSREISETIANLFGLHPDAASSKDRADRES